MKPVNSNLGASGSLVSRVSSISSSQASIDSVVFQQGKSILDFDLNVTQDVLKNSIESLARSILSKSGFLKLITIGSSYASPNVTISIPPVDVALLGKIVRLSSSSANGTINSTANVSSGAFFWIELWYQEIIPEGTTEPGKTSVIKTYGYADDTGASLVNTMKDTTFGAETTRRVQLRWRVRSAQSTSSDFTNAAITAMGGNQAGVAGYNFYLSNSYASASSEENLTVLGASSVKNSLLEYALLNDSGVYIAGRGTDADAQALNTIDGRVYAFSLCTVAANNSSLTNTCSVVGATTAGVLSGSSATIGNLNISSEVSATTLSIVNTAANSSNIVLTPANSGFVSGPNFQLSGDGTVSVPALRFSSSTSTGLYYTSASTVPELNISTAGVQRLKINASALTVSGNIIAQTTNAYIQVGAGSITGLGTGESMITSLNALTFRSANVSITGGSISGTSISGTITAVAKTNFAIAADINYTHPSGSTLIVASNTISANAKNGIVFIPGANTLFTSSYDDNYLYLTITTGTSLFEIASGDSITPSTYVGKPSDSWSEGVSTRPARRDHIHKREGYATTTVGVPTSLYTTLTDPALVGTSTTVARGDHTHTLGSSIPAIGIGSARTSSLTSVLEVTGTISGSVGHLTIRDFATNAANIGGKLSFAGVDYATATTFLSYGSIGIYREASTTNNTYASFVTRSAANLIESLRLYKNASARISTTAADYASAAADGSIEVENGAIAKYFKASLFVISTGVSTGASRFIGSVGAKPTTNTNVLAGDFVIDTTGNIHVYSGSTSGWLTAGILTSAANSWTGSQQFGINRTWAETSSLTNTASAINMSSYNITLSAAQGSDSVRTMYVGGNVVTSAASSTTVVAANKVYAITAIGTATNWATAAGTGTLALYPTTGVNVDYFTAGSTAVTLNSSSSTVTELLPLLTASTQDINGPPSFAGYSYIIHSYGLRILTKAVTANTYPISGTSAYGLQVGIPTKASVVYGIHIPTVTATNSAFAYGLHVTAPTGATNNYGIYVASGSVVLADTTASTSSTTGSLQVAGGIYVAKSSIFAGNVGIGISGPTSTLHVVAPNTSDIEARFTGGNTQGIAIQNGTLWEYRVDADTGEIAFNYTGYNSGTTRFRNTTVYNGKYGQIAFFQGSTSRLGLGVGSPAEKLHVAGNVLLDNNNGFYVKNNAGNNIKIGAVDILNQLEIGNANATSTYFTTGQNFYWSAGGAYRGNINGTNGYWRIGDSTAASYELDVVGTAKVSTSILLGTQGATLDEYAVGNQALRIYSNTAGKSLWIGFAGGVQLNNSLGITGNVSLSASTTDVYTSITNTASGGRSWIINATSTTSGEGGGKLLFKDATANPVATRMTIDSAGYVGIGTTSPGYKLDVAGDIRLSNNNAMYWSDSGGTGRRLAVMAASGHIYLGDVDNALSGGYLYVNSSSVISLRTNAVERMVISSSGNVGIRTASPNFGLHIQGTDATALMIERTANNTTSSDTYTRGLYIRSGTSTSDWGIAGTAYTDAAFTNKAWWTASGKIAFGAGGRAPSDLVIDTNGRVGIGTGTPGYKLEVSGDMFVSGNISGTFNGNITGNLTGFASTSGTAQKIVGGASAYDVQDMIFATMADNDYFRIKVGGASNNGFVEFATADDGNEPIYFRQYSTTQFTWPPVRTATILDGAGDTFFPGILTAARFSGPLNGTVGATTASTGAFTTLSASSTVSGGVAPRCVIPAAAFLSATLVTGPSLIYVTTGVDKYELQYAYTADSIAYATLNVPRNYGGGNIYIRIYWYIDSGTNSKVSWNALFSSVVENGAINTSVSSVATLDAGVGTGATSGTLIVSTLTWSTSLPAAGSLLYFALKRSAVTSTWDTSTANANVQAVSIEFGS